MTMRNMILTLFATCCVFLLQIDQSDAATVGGRIAADTTWTLANSPYTVTSTVQVYGTATTPVTLTIEAGVVVNFNAAMGLQIGSGTDKGALISRGTSTNRITFTRIGASGTWAGITFNDPTVDATTMIEYADIQYATTGITMNSASPTIKDAAITATSSTGYGVNLTTSNPMLNNVSMTNDGYYGLYLYMASSPTISGGSIVNTNASGYGIYGQSSASPVISNLTVSIVDTPGKYGMFFNNPTSSLSITDSTIGNGLYLGNVGITPTITGNTFTNLANSPIRAGANVIGQISSGNTLVGLTSTGKIDVAAETITRDATWKKLPAPYVVSGTFYIYKDSTTPATLTIEPGTSVKFAVSAQLVVGYNSYKGALVSRGTPTERILFTRSGTSGTWAGISFNDATDDATTMIEYSDIQYASIGMQMNSASPTIKDSTITATNTSVYAMSLNSASPTLTNVSMISDGTDVLYLAGSSSPRIAGGSITNANVAGYGIHSYSTGSPIISGLTVSIVNTPGKYGAYFSSPTTGLSISNSTIGNGLYIGSTGITPTITGNTFTNLDNSPIHVGANIIGQIVNSNTLSGLTSAGKIEVAGETVKQDARWLKLPAPYVQVSGAFQVFKDATTSATLTIDPGVTIQFADWSQLTIGSGTSKGALIARGTPSERILFTRATGTWSGIYFDSATVDATTKMEYADIQYATTGITMASASPTIKDTTIVATSSTGYGMNLTSSSPILDNVSITTVGFYGMYLQSSSAPTITGGSITNTNATGQGIYSYYGTSSPVISGLTVSIVNTPGKYGVNLSSSATSSLSITNSTIGNGLFIASAGITPTITGNTFTNLDDSPLHAGANIIDQILNNNTLNGMTSAGKIEVTGETIAHDALWKNWFSPYIVQGSVTVAKDLVTAATLTIEAGTTLKFADNMSLLIGTSTGKGVLSAVGTAANKVLFTSNNAIPGPGKWTGISLYGSGASASVIENAIIEYGGSGGAATQANVILNAASATIRKSNIRNSLGSGIYLVNSTTSALIDSCTITGNKWGVYSSASNPALTNTIITGNTTAGVTNSMTTPLVDARNCWWGSASGPTVASNPTGTGSIISNYVTYSPWLTQAPGSSSVIISNTQAQPGSLNPDGDFTTISAAISEPADWTVVITDSNNNQVRHLSGTGTTVNAKWYGENDQSQKVSDGGYYYVINAVSTAWGVPASSPQGLIVVTRQIPVAIFTQPVDNQMFAAGSVINVTGTATDSTDYWFYRLEYGEGVNPSAWTTIKDSGATTTNGTLYAWNTAGLTGSFYTLRLMVYDHTSNIATETAVVRLHSIQNATASESYISPNADAVKDAFTITAVINFNSNWTVSIKNSSNQTVRSFTGAGTAVSQSWDGKDTASQVVPDGAYTYQIDAASTETNVAALPKTGTVIVDTAPPTAQITAPSSNAVVHNTVLISGTASDAIFNDYRVEYGPAEGIGPWSTVTTTTIAVSGGTLATWVTNDQTNAVILQNGGYVIRLTTTDKAGNSSTISIPVNADNLLLTGVSAGSHTIDTSLSQSVGISYTINSAATVTLRVVPEKQGPGGPTIYQAAQASTGGAGVFTWDGRDNTGKAVPDEAYLYVLEAAEGNRSDSYSPAALIGTGTVTCTQSTDFDPEKNVPLIVTYTPSQPSRINVRVFSGSIQFKILDAGAAAAGSHTVAWEGWSPGNSLLLGQGVTSSCTVTALLRENHIITTGDTISATEVKTDPYAPHLSFGQFTHITYTLPCAAGVTIKLTSPGGADVFLINNELQVAGPHGFDWNGIDASDETGKKLLVSEEGEYMVSVQAANPLTGTSSTTKAHVRLGF